MISPRSTPNYTQQLAFYYWNYLEKNAYQEDMLAEVVRGIVTIHAADFERLWNTISKTDKKILIAIAMQEKMASLAQPTSTTYSGLKRLFEQGYLIKNEHYELDDPFFRHWIIERRNA